MLPLHIGTIASAPSPSPGVSVADSTSWLDPSQLIPSLISAIVAGVVAAFLAHLWSRKRAKEDWLRNRLFELVSDLMDANREFGKSCQRLEWDTKGRTFVWNPLEEAVSLFTDAVAKISLLTTTDRTLEVLLESLRTAYESAATEAIEMGKAHSKEVRKSRDLAPYMQESLDELHVTFQGVREFITAEYLLYWKD